MKKFIIAAALLLFSYTASAQVVSQCDQTMGMFVATMSNAGLSFSLTTELTAEQAYKLIRYGEDDTSRFGEEVVKAYIYKVPDVGNVVVFEGKDACIFGTVTIISDNLMYELGFNV